MPIIFPTVYHFDNQIIQKTSYTKVTVDYSKQKIACELLDPNSNLRIFQNKWYLHNYDSGRTIESDSPLIDFSVAQKFPNINCETILFDGLLFKKVHVSAAFSNFQNWPNLSPGVFKYSLSNLSNFSIANYVKTKEDSQYYFCESGANQISEKFFCSLLDKDTGSIERKNNDTNKFLNIIGNENYKILDLNIGIKQKNKIIQATGVQFIIQKEDGNSINLPPTIQFIDTNNIKNLYCNSLKFLYKPNDNKIIWTKNNKEISNFNNSILPEQYIRYNDEYKCLNNNGESQRLEISKKYLKINGLKQIEIRNNDNIKSVKYSANLNLPQNDYEWSCINSLNVKCEIITNKIDQTIELKISPTLQFKRSVFPEKIKLILSIDNDKIEKEIIIFNSTKDNEKTLDISENLDLSKTNKENQYHCNIQDSFDKSALFEIYWFKDNQELLEFRNIDSVNIFLSENNLTCIVAGKILNRSIIGAKTLFVENPSKENPSWLKENYLINLNKPNKFLLFTENSDSNISNMNCEIQDQNNNTIFNNLCKKENKSIYYLNITQNILDDLKNYFHTNPPIDIFNLPILKFNVSFIENNIFRKYFSKVKIINENLKPVILASGLKTLKNGTQECYIFVQDPQSLYLSTEFYLENNKKNINLSSLNNYNMSDFDMLNQSLINSLEKSNILLYLYNFKEKKLEDSCVITVSNGTTVSKTKAVKNLSSNELKKTLIQQIKKIENRKAEQIFSQFKYLKKSDLSAKNLELKFVQKNIDQQKNPLSLSFSNDTKRRELTISYNIEKINENLANEYQNNISNNIKINTEIPQNKDNDYFIPGFFMSAHIDESTIHEHNFSCKTDLHNLYDNQIIYKYSVFLNGNIYLQKKSTLPYFDFEISNYKDTDTISCLIQVNNKIATSSLNKSDKTKILSLCYALDKNNSIVLFQCPTITSPFSALNNFKVAAFKAMSQHFQNTDFISLFHMVIWSESQKNKFSFSFDITHRD
ncbi:hypothetical protein [Fluviispira vulneris]|uniref:hypothetical protein n=1 Tax=Fluviispira vulneris TaxID=2763012 RepID=UPI00164831AF|nr:hypothetical protein [Fluviispira vulneris]